jgi:hypothetical protein
LLVYPSAIDLSTHTLRYLAGQLASRRREIGTRWRRLTAGRQALLALAHLRCGDTYVQLAAGFGIGLATVYRYVREAIDVLAVLAPTLDEAIANPGTRGLGSLIAGGPRAKVVATTFRSIKLPGFAGPWMTLLMSSVMARTPHLLLPSREPHLFPFGERSR